jgi:pyridoxine 5-phosphate synthase
MLKQLCQSSNRELNVEGYPSERFLAVVLSARPEQCTLVPDSPGQLTSDHGWEIAKHRSLLTRVAGKLREAGIRVSLFMDASSREIELAQEIGADRIELYTEPYAAHFGSPHQARTLATFREAAARARGVGLGVNAGHDLSLDNLQAFLAIPEILEVSIGHALVVECLELGVKEVLSRYLQIVGGAVQPT